MAKLSFDQYDTLEIIENVLNNKSLLDQLTECGFKIVPEGKGQTHIQLNIDLQTNPLKETPEMSLHSGQRIELR